MRANVDEKNTFYVDQPLADQEFHILVDKLEFFSNEDNSVLFCKLPETAYQYCGMFFDIEVSKCYDYEDFEPTETLGYHYKDHKVYVPMSANQVVYLNEELKKMGAVCDDEYVAKMRKRYAEAFDDLEQGLWGYGY